MSRRINHGITTPLLALLSGFAALMTLLIAFTFLILEGVSPESTNNSVDDTSQLSVLLISIFTLAIALAITALTFRERLRFSRVSSVTIALAGAPRAGCRPGRCRSRRCVRDTSGAAGSASVRTTPRWPGRAGGTGRGRARS